MKKYFLLILAIIFMAFFSCKETTQLTDSDKDALVQSVKQASQEYWSFAKQPYNNTTSNETFKFMDEDADQRWQTDPVAVVFNTSITNTQAELKNSFKSLFDNRISSNPTILESYYSVLANDKVLEVIRGDYTITLKDSTVTDPFTMVNTTIWENTNGDWKIQFVHNSFRKK